MYRWLDNDKKRHYIYAATLSELRRKEKEISQNVNDGINTEKSNMRLDDLYDWWKNNKIGIKESTYVNYVYMYERFIGPRIGHMKLKDIIYNVYGRDITANLYDINAKTQDIKIEGYIGKPFINRGNRTYENYYINGRYIKSNIINKAIEEAYKGFIMPHNYL